MKKKKKHRKRNLFILTGIILLYLGAMVYSALTVDKPTTIIVEPVSATVQMNGISKVSLNVKILDNNGKPMSGQEISFKLLSGSGKVTTILGVTSSDGVAIGEYQAGYGDIKRTAEVYIQNTTGLSKTVEINEIPNTTIPDKIVLDVNTEQEDILENGLEISVTLLDANGNAVPQHKLLFKVVSGSVGFYGFKMMSQVTDDEGKASLRYQPAEKGDVVINIESEAYSSVFKTFSFTVK